MPMPLGATYCHSGPSCPNSQFFHVLPPSVESPQPLPTVPYQISPLGPNAKAWTKFQEIECAAVSRDERICSQLVAPFRNTKIPWPYVPIQIERSGANERARTCTPKPDESGSGTGSWAGSDLAATTVATTHNARRTVILPSESAPCADP